MSRELDRPEPAARTADRTRPRPHLGGGILAVLAAVALAGTGCGSGEEAERGSSQAPRPTVVWAVGDLHARHPQAPAVVKLLQATPGARVLYTGDVYPEGTAEDFRANFDTVFAPVAARTLPTPGNHDWANRATGYFPYWSRARGRRQRPWYREKIGGWEIISLNSETDMGPGSAQMRWLRSQLRGRETCRIAFWHRPRYSAGATHGDEEAVAPLWEAVRGRATIVVAGHDHNLQRLAPREGSTQFVSGAGGAKPYPIDRADGRLRFGAEDRFGALRLELRPGVARHAFVDVDGEVLDQGRITCRG